MADEIRIEMMRRNEDQKYSPRLRPFVRFPLGGESFEFVCAYKYFLQACCEFREYARCEKDFLREKCREFFEEHGAIDSKVESGSRSRGLSNAVVALGGVPTKGAYLGVAFGSSLSRIEQAINEINKRNDPVFVDEIAMIAGPGRLGIDTPWRTKFVWNNGKQRTIILRETVPPPIVPDGPR